MFQLNDDFLASCGVTGLSDDQKAKLLLYLQQELEDMVGDRLTEGLSDEQLDEYDGLLEGSDGKVEAWLASHVPDWQNDGQWQQLKNSPAAAGVEEAVLKSDFASIKWLEANQLRYRELVDEALQQLQALTSRNKDALVASFETTQSGENEQNQQ